MAKAPSNVPKPHYAWGVPLSAQNRLAHLIECSPRWEQTQKLCSSTLVTKAFVTPVSGSKYEQLCHRCQVMKPRVAVVVPDGPLRKTYSEVKANQKSIQERKKK